MEKQDVLNFINTELKPIDLDLSSFKNMSLSSLLEFFYPLFYKKLGLFSLDKEQLINLLKSYGFEQDQSVNDGLLVFKIENLITIRMYPNKVMDYYTSSLYLDKWVYVLHSVTYHLKNKENFNVVKSLSINFQKKEFNDISFWDNSLKVIQIYSSIKFNGIEFDKTVKDAADSFNFDTIYYSKNGFVLLIDFVYNKEIINSDRLGDILTNQLHKELEDFTVLEIWEIEKKLTTEHYNLLKIIEI